MILTLESDGAAGKTGVGALRASPPLLRVRVVLGVLVAGGAHDERGDACADADADERSDAADEEGAPRACAAWAVRVRGRGCQADACDEEE